MKIKITKIINTCEPKKWNDKTFYSWDVMGNVDGGEPLQYHVSSTDQITELENIEFDLTVSQKNDKTNYYIRLPKAGNQKKEWKSSKPLFTEEEFKLALLNCKIFLSQLELPTPNDRQEVFQIEDLKHKYFATFISNAREGGVKFSKPVVDNSTKKNPSNYEDDFYQGTGFDETPVTPPKTMTERYKTILEKVKNSEIEKKFRDDWVILCGGSTSSPKCIDENMIKLEKLFF
ncbi:MAG: hypothetical protein ACYDEI_00195 [Erysipelotrichaceae bacterium]